MAWRGAGSGAASPPPPNPTRCRSAGKCRGLRTARKLRSHRRDQKWHDKQYKKAHLGTALKANPFGGASHAKGIVLEKVWVIFGVVVGNWLPLAAFRTFYRFLLPFIRQISVYCFYAPC